MPFEAYSSGKHYKSILYKTRTVAKKEKCSDDNLFIALNEQLIKNKQATFFLRVTTNAMNGAHINAGDIIIADRSLEPENGRIVIAVIDGEMLIRRLEKSTNKIRLFPEGSNLSGIEIGNFSAVKIWGVVTHIIKSV
jgi:DNA polymerase V